MAKPTKAHDLRLEYADAEVVLEPRSPAGMALAVPWEWRRHAHGGT